MKKNLTGGSFLFLLLPLVLGCAASHYSQGKKELARENYDSAIAALQKAVKENPQNAAAVRDLGVAYFKKNELASALDLFNAALRRDPKDALTMFYIGAAQEQKGDVEAAIKTYSQYPSAIGDHARDAMRARLEHIVRERLRQQAKAILAQEAQLAATAPPEKSLAVLYFRNLGKNRELDPLQKGLADMLITDLSQVKSLKVVERARLQSLLEEMGLGMTGLVDETTAPRVGRLLGAREMVNGAFIDLSQEQLRIDAGLFQSTGGEVTSEALNGPLAKFFRMEKDLALKVLDRMGITPTPDERDAILRIPTENLLAFLAYSQGLDYEDRGMTVEAEKSYKEAVRHDSKFQAAQRNMNRMQALAGFPPRLQDTERMVNRSPDFQRPTATRPVGGRLALTAINTGTAIGRMPSAAEDETRGNDRRQPALEESGTFGATGQIRISVPLPR
jgi:TolB-like protein